MKLEGSWACLAAQLRWRNRRTRGSAVWPQTKVSVVGSAERRGNQGPPRLLPDRLADHHARAAGGRLRRGSARRVRAVRNGRHRQHRCGLSPGDLHDAYKLPAIPAGNFVWNGQTVAVVDAYDNPNAANDLLTYRRQFGLPAAMPESDHALFFDDSAAGIVDAWIMRWHLYFEWRVESWTDIPESERRRFYASKVSGWTGIRSTE